MLRRIPLFALILALTAPLAAQAPDGLMVRVDRSTDASDPDNTPELKVMAMGKGFHVIGGPAGTFWDPKNTVAGNYTVRATFNLMEPSNHTNYYGLVFGGSNLNGPNQAYSYFVVAQTGQFQVRDRTGEKVVSIQRPAAHAAIKTPDAKGQSTNTLEVRVGAQNVDYVVNGTVVHTTPRTAVKTEGLVGVRINHMLNVHVDGFSVQKN